MNAERRAAAPSAGRRVPLLDPLTVVYVAFGVTGLDVSWLEPEDAVILVHNDDLLPMGTIKHCRAIEVVSGRNVGYGAGVNAALELVHTSRVVLCNPDTQLSREHRRLLAGTDPDEVVAVALDDERGEPTWTVLPYPGALAAVAMGHRLGRGLGRRSRLRDLGSRLLTAGRTPYASLLGARSGSWPLATHWVSAAVLSIDAGRLREVGGFEAGYFLYMEDVDLSRRLAERFPSMRVRLPGGEPGRHAVGGSAAARSTAAVELDRIRSLRRYCSLQPGRRWGVAGAALWPRSWWLERRAGATR
jgi:N-acetylglucosaminyl-diphospho-decaprenol L-rhamnosyltransferase